MRRRYCEMCDEWFPPRRKECPECGLSLSKAVEYCGACDREGATAGGDTVAIEFHACSQADAVKR